MTDIPEAAKVRACELANVAAAENNREGYADIRATDWQRMWPNALARFIAEASELAELADEALADTGYLPGASGLRARIGSLILSDEPDGLAETIKEMGKLTFTPTPDDFRAALAKRGLKIVKDES